MEIPTGRASAAGPRGHHPARLLFVSHVDTESMLMETKHPISSHAIMTATLHVQTAVGSNSAPLTTCTFSDGD